MHDFADLNGNIFLSQNSPLSLTARHDFRATDLGFWSRLLVLAIALYCRKWFVYYQRAFCYSYYSFYFYLRFPLNYAHFRAETLLASLLAMKTFDYPAC